MRLGVLFSGGKDSCYALKIAMEKEKVCCLISLLSKNKESYMFHTPNVALTKLQAEAIGLPLICVETEGVKEEELKDLKKAIALAKKKYGVEGIVTGANESVYQASRVQKICDELSLWCFNPLWKMDQAGLVEEIIEAGFEVIISGVFAYPLTKEVLGRKIDRPLLIELIRMRDKYGISPSGEGGEIETTVLNATFFKNRINIIDAKITWDGNSGIYNIKQAQL